MIKAAVIGVGNMGINHARVFQEIEIVDLVGVCDINEPQAKKIARIYHTDHYTDFRQMLDKTRPNLVSIVVPANLHAPIAYEVIKRKINLLIEKPISSDVLSAKKIIKMAEKFNVKLAVGHLERYNPAIAELKKRLDKGALGRIFQIHARRISPYPKKIIDVGVTLDIAVHDIDIMRHLLNLKLKRVFAEVVTKTKLKTEDLISGILTFKDGVIGVLDVNWITPNKIREISVLGEKGLFLVDYLTQDLFWYKNNYYPGKWDNLSLFQGSKEGDVVKIHIEKQEPLYIEISSFVNTILGKNGQFVSGQEGLETLLIAEKLLESGKINKPIKMS